MGEETGPVDDRPSCAHSTHPPVGPFRCGRLVKTASWRGTGWAGEKVTRSSPPVQHLANEKEEEGKGQATLYSRICGSQTTSFGSEMVRRTLLGSSHKDSFLFV
jgi:hypothetical protein